MPVMGVALVAKLLSIHPQEWPCSVVKRTVFFAGTLPQKLVPQM